MGGCGWYLVARVPTLHSIPSVWIPRLRLRGSVSTLLCSVRRARISTLRLGELVRVPLLVTIQQNSMPSTTSSNSSVWVPTLHSRWSVWVSALRSRSAWVHTLVSPHS